MSDPKQENKDSIVENIANCISEFAKKNNLNSVTKIKNPNPVNNNLQNSPLNRYWGKDK